MTFVTGAMFIFCLLMLAVPVTMAAWFLRKKIWPATEPRPGRYYWTGATIPLLLFVMFFPMLVPGGTLAVLWFFIVLWIGVAYAGSVVMRRVMSLAPQVRSLASALIFAAFLVVPLVYVFIVPRMEAEAQQRLEAQRRADRIALEKRAENGSPTAQASIAQKYAAGADGLAPDFETAAKWYKLAALQGDAEAQAILGRYYADGKGVPQDDKEAYYWLAVALAHAPDGDKGWIKGVMTRVALYMDSADVKAAEKRAAAFKPAKND